MRTFLNLPSSLVTSMVSLLLSHQYKFLPIQSTAIPSRLRRGEEWTICNQMDSIDNSIDWNMDWWTGNHHGDSHDGPQCRQRRINESILMTATMTMMSDRFYGAVDLHPGDVAPHPRDVRPVQHLLLPVEVEGHGILKVGDEHVDDGPVQRHASDVIPVRHQQPCLDVCRSRREQITIATLSE